MALSPASVVIPSWNGAALLAPTLEHLLKLEGVEFEVLVVDHGRLNRDSELLVERFSRIDSRIKYLGLDEQLGYAGAVNHGTLKARFSLIAVLCNDVLVEPGWLAALVRKFQERSDQGKTAVVSSSVTRPGFDEPLRARINIWGRIVHTGEDPERYVPFFPDGSAFLFDKTFLGLPFNSEYFLYQEDVSLGWRSWLKGGEVVLARDSRALNADGGTTRRTPYKTAFFTERNRWLNALEYFSVSVLLRVMPLLVVDAFLRILAGSNRQAKLHAWGWLLLHPRAILSARSEIQKQRVKNDRDFLSLVSLKYSNGAAFSVLNRICKLYGMLTALPFSR